MSDAIEKMECLIIGSGPAGYTAAIYAARQESARQVNEMMNIASEARKKWNEDYLSNNTLRNGETMSGLLNIKYKKGDKIVLKIIIDDFEYPFEWSPSESEN